MCRTTNATIGIKEAWMCGKPPYWIATILFSFIVAFPGTIVILLNMLDKIRKRTPFTPSDIFVLNINIMDNVYLVSLQPQLYINIDTVNCVYDAFVIFLHTFNMCGRPLFVTCVCLECYMAVIHPVTYRTRKGLTSRLLISVVNWIVTVMYGLYFVWFHLNTSDLSPVLIIIMTLPIIVFCDMSILSALKKTRPTRRNIDPHKRRALYTVSSSCVITVISYLPPIISWSILQHKHFRGKTIDPCIILMPALCATTVGNAVSIILHVGKTGILDWLKSWLKSLYK